MTEGRPFRSWSEVIALSEAIWATLDRNDVIEAASHHPRIGADREQLKRRFATTAVWSAGEQAGVASADEAVIDALANANADYERRFGYQFIVCATGKGAPEILAILRERLSNDANEEWRIARDELAKICTIRLEKLRNELGQQ